MKQLRNLKESLTKERLVIAGVIVLLISLQAWTWSKRYPLFLQKRAEISSIHDLEAEVAQLQVRWNAKTEERSKVAKDLEGADGRLFEGEPSSSTWSAQIGNPPSSLSFAVRPERVVTPPEYSDRLSILPTVWMVKSPGEGEKGFTDLLIFLHHLTTKQPKWMDLTDLLISGNEVTQTRAEFTMRLWFGKEPAS